MLTFIFVLAVFLFVLAYFFYGRFLDRRFNISDQNPTPSHTDYDGIDRVPAKKPVLLGHHFSSIAGAGPIVGPIIAAVAFGWLPALLWIILGSIFIGGVHDFSALAASIRHKARSIAEIAREHMSPLSFRLFLLFVWLLIIYILVVFTDLTATTFVQDKGVATSSILFMALAVGFGIFVYRMNVSVLKASLIFVPLVFVAAFMGGWIPIDVNAIPFLQNVDAAKTWGVILIIYCFIASTTPVWILLQPRDYLSSYLLYASVLSGLLGILFGGFAMQYPSFIGWEASQVGSLFPILFITVACGACSGFHAIVASGTSSKQINKESDVRTIGYGAMLIEGLVAVIAVITVAMIANDGGLSSKPPLVIYGTGIGKFLGIFGVPMHLGYSFGLLALSTFILTTLDTATRLGRYIFEEIFSIKNPKYRYFSTLATIALPLVFLFVTFHDQQGNPVAAWKAIWPVFGVTNQLLAGLTFLVIFVWLKKEEKKAGFIVLPMVFMVVMTIWALILLINDYGFSAIGILSIMLMGLAFVLIYETVRVVLNSSKDKSPAVQRLYQLFNQKSAS
ncbi:MAG: carbon starvation protein A [Syntrophomonadaceae bacterium]